MFMGAGGKEGETIQFIAGSKGKAEVAFLETFDQETEILVLPGLTCLRKLTLYLPSDCPGPCLLSSAAASRRGRALSLRCVGP